MSDYSRIIMQGRLTADPELRYSNAGTPICTLKLASNRTYKQNDEPQKEVCYVDATAFGKTAELVAQYLAKGSAVLVDGRLKHERWEKDGQKHSKHTIQVESVTFLDKKGDGGHVDS